MKLHPGFLAVGIGALSLVRVDATPLQTAAFEGFVPYPFATTGDAPGTIFRIDAQGRRFIATAPLSSVKVYKDAVESPRYSQKRQFKVSLLISFLQSLGLAGSPRGQLSADLQREMTLEVRNATREYTIDDEVETALRAKLKTLVRKEGSTYYVVRETIASKTVNYGVSSDVVAEVGGEAALSKAAAGKAGLKVASGSGTKLEREFAKPMRVFYKAERVAFATGAFGGRSGQFQRVPVTEMLTWTEGGKDP